MNSKGYTEGLARDTARGIHIPSWVFPIGLVFYLKTAGQEWKVHDKNERSRTRICIIYFCTFHSCAIPFILVLQSFNRITFFFIYNFWEGESFNRPSLTESEGFYRPSLTVREGLIKPSPPRNCIWKRMLYFQPKLGIVSLYLAWFGSIYHTFLHIECIREVLNNL